MAELAEDPAATAVIAHGLLGDVGVIKTAAATLSQYWETLDPVMREKLLKMVVSHTERLGDVLNDLARGLPVEALLGALRTEVGTEE